MNNSLVYAISAVVCVAMICITAAGVLVDSTVAAVIITGIGGIATLAIPQLISLSNQTAQSARSASQATEIKQQIAHATERIPEKVAENVADKVAQTLASGPQEVRVVNAEPVPVHEVGK